MRTGRLLETSPSNQYWQKYEVGEWSWGWGTSDTQLVRWRLDIKHIPQTWRPPSPYGCHGALPPAPLHTTISQHAAQPVYVVKTRECYCFYYLLAILRHDASSAHRACVFSGCGWWKPIILIGLINRVGRSRSFGLLGSRASKKWTRSDVHKRAHCCSLLSETSQ
jgi:hypothetical protein